MDLKTLPLNALRAFDAIVRTQSISKAAKSLQVTQSAISQQQKLLEMHLGIRLFKRSGKQLKLTPEGEIYAKHVNSIFDNLQLATKELLNARLSEEILTVNTSTYFAMRGIMPGLARFQSLHPDIEVRISTPIKPIEERTHDIDVGIYYGQPSDWPNLESFPIMKLEVTPVCSPRYLEKFVKSDDSMPNIRDFTILLNKSNDVLSANFWTEWLKIYNNPGLEQLKTVPLESQAQAIFSAVNDGGIAITDLAMTTELLKHGQLVMPWPRQIHSLPGAIHLVYPPEMKKKQKFNLFKEWIVREMENVKRKTNN